MITQTQNTQSSLLRKLSIVPVTLFALFAFSIKPADISNVTVISQSASNSDWQEPWTPQHEIEGPIVAVGYARNVSPQKEVQVIRSNARKNAPGTISYNDVEQKPVFPGHPTDFVRLISRNIAYPHKAMENGISGKVVVSFVVDTEGNVTDVKSPVKIDLLSDELERAVKSVYRWKPGSHGGKNVAVQCYMFAEFRLETDENK